MKEKIIEIDNDVKLAIGMHDDSDGYALEVREDIYDADGGWMELPLSINLSRADLFQIMKAIGTELRKKANQELHYCERRENGGFFECQRICRHCKYVQSCTEWTTG
jgi:hypothetical protein